MIKIICPKCNEEIEIDRNRPNAFCNYCGEKIESNFGVYNMHCPSCNEIVDADLSRDSGFCNYCGCRIDYNHSHENISRGTINNEVSINIEKASANTVKRHSALGIVAFVLALTGILAPIAIILSIVDLATSKKNETKKHGLAVAGLIIGSIATFLGLLVGPIGCGACVGFVEGFTSGFENYVPDDTVIEREHIRVTVPGEFGYQELLDYDYSLNAFFEFMAFAPDDNHCLIIGIIDSYVDPTQKYGSLNSLYYELDDVCMEAFGDVSGNGAKVKYVDGKEALECTGIIDMDGDKYTYTFTYVYDLETNSGIITGLFVSIGEQDTLTDEYNRTINSIVIK